MSGARDRPAERAARLLAGLVLFGLSLALLVKAGLGLDPWTVLSEGVSLRTGLSLGQVTILSSVALLLVWVPLRQRPGPGTVANALIVGPVLDLGVWLIPAPHALAGQIAMLVAAILGTAIATGLYVGAGWGPGPRDGLMTGLAALGVPVAAARTAIELSVLAAGWALGGTVGVATALFAASIGPLVATAMPRLVLRSPRRCSDATAAV
ncbi:MAG: hypothetical protein QOJ46_1444 [bacterium]|jgi:uncharacterized membrane protein YczE